MASGLVTTRKLSFVELTRQARERVARDALQGQDRSHRRQLGVSGSVARLVSSAGMNRDTEFILSKGHAAGALYVTLWTLGRVNDDDLDQFHRDGTRFSGHPPAHGIAEVLFATGSLGHGLGLAAGLALGKQLQGTHGRVFCLTSDGEWNEGSC